MEKIMFVQRIKEGKISEYVDYHKNAWPDLLKVLKEFGTQEEIIWQYRDLVLVYISAENFDESMAEISKNEVFQKWHGIMQTLLSEIQDYSEKGKIDKLEKIFDLNEQLKKL